MSGSLACALSICLVVVGCSPSVGRSFAVTIPGQASISPLLAVLLDKSGVIQSVAAEVPAATESDSAITNPPEEPDVLLVTWIGGTCDHRVEFVFDGGADAYTLSGVTERDSGCTLSGIARSIRIQLSTPVPADTVEFQSP